MTGANTGKTRANKPELPKEERNKILLLAIPRSTFSEQPLSQHTIRTYHKAQCSYKVDI